MNINEMRERPKRVSFKTPHRKALSKPHSTFNSPALPTSNQEEPNFIFILAAFTPVNNNYSLYL